MPTTPSLGIVHIAEAQYQKATAADVAFDNFDRAIAQHLSKSVAGSSNVTLSAAESLYAALTLTGLLTGNINVVVPTVAKTWLIYNNTSGAFTVTVKTSAGTGIVVTQGVRVHLYCDATNVLDVGAISGGAGATGASALSAITAAVGSNSILNGDNAQVWQWALTTSGKVAFRYTENTASVAAGTPVLFQADTIAASTAVPFLVKNRGTEVIRVRGNSANSQLLGADGTSAVPLYSFLSAMDAGMFNGGSYIGFAHTATEIFRYAYSGSIARVYFPAGTVAAPGITCAGGSNQGGIVITDTTLDLCQASMEHTRFAGTAAGVNTIRSSRGSANATAFLYDFRKSRGSNSSPAAITTGDDILDLDGSAYVGGTGLYVTCAGIKYTTEGTIANTATGVGGVIKLYTMAVGSAIAERGRMDSLGNFVWTTAALATTATDGFIYVPSCAGTPTGVPTTYTGRVPMIFDTTGVKIWFYTGGAWKGVVVA